MAKIWKPQPIEVYVHWIETIIEESSDNLTDWEISFIENIQAKLAFNSNLSESQAKKLEELYVKHTS